MFFKDNINSFMTIKISKYIGFCFGVSRVVNSVFKNSDKKIKILGEIVHNEILINKLKKNKNITFIEDVKEVRFGDTVVTRAHGEKNNILKHLVDKGAFLVDMTCPKVAAIQNIVEKSSRKNVFIIIGDKNHPEIISIVSRNDLSIIIDNLSSAKNFISDVKFKKKNFISRYIVAAQTTYDLEKYKEVCDFLKDNLENVEFKNTICGDILKRREEILENAPKSDLVIVIGSEKSSNTRNLFIIAQKFCKSILISNKKCFDFEILRSKSKIFLCSGASAMKETAEEFINSAKKYCLQNKLDLEIQR
ncbi:MAG: 4-hydroxy-3-methylbut-2-enyl diphosphate reductase [Oscillospiraceae bacterium]|nr:4-hydroxy-3-methylbut-2-enyl diphosphate reductase [Oscillospiraceae bacterium]